MSKLDIGLTVINVVLAIISGVGAYRSIKYFRKSRNLAIYAQTNTALTEIQKVLMKLPEALALQIRRSLREALAYQIHYAR